MSVIHSDFETLKERTEQLYQLNILACCVQLLLFTLSAWFGSDSMGLNIVQSLATFIFILTVILRQEILSKVNQLSLIHI